MTLAHDIVFSNIKEDVTYNYNDNIGYPENHYLNMGINIQKLIDATEIFTAFMYFLYEARDIKSMKLLVGKLKYEDWECELLCYLEEDGKIYFKEENHTYRILADKCRYRTLTDLCFGYSFAEADIKISYRTINHFLNSLEQQERFIFDEFVAEIHSEFW